MAGRKRIDIIVNPAAGARGSGLFDAVLRRLNEGGAFVRCFDTEAPGHATELAARLAHEGHADVIVAAGGDGTINEVARGLLGHPTPLGVLPLGTANVLAIEIGQKAKARQISDTLINGNAKLIGTGLVAGEIFLLMVGAGFDGRVVGAIRPAMKRRLGKLAFIWEGLKAWVSGPAADIELEVDGVPCRAAWVVVTNARHYAGPFVLSRRSDVTRPGLEVFLFRRTSRLAFAGYFLGLVLGRVANMPGVTRIDARHVYFREMPGVPVEVDGDTWGVVPVTIEQGERFLRLVVPQA
ncbi:MAG: diacylglycerol kinase family protein [Parvibaculaceae bacterium]